MITFKVRDMFSSRSAGTIVKTLKALDSGARVRVNMETYSVEIEPSWARSDAFREAIGRAGFTPEPARMSQSKGPFTGGIDLVLPLE
ncbi:MAG: heavy-metal-associated domain-containing protein [Cytophagales bacterium]|nr:heavy-metal-associated domain-containing protein [Rhizobacter sp.]